MQLFDTEGGSQDTTFLLGLGETGACHCVRLKSASVMVVGEGWWPPPLST